jgi:hypothetical protein
MVVKDAHHKFNAPVRTGKFLLRGLADDRPCLLGGTTPSIDKPCDAGRLSRELVAGLLASAIVIKTLIMIIVSFKRHLLCT